MFSVVRVYPICSDDQHVGFRSLETYNPRISQQIFSMNNHRWDAKPPHKKKPLLAKTVDGVTVRTLWVGNLPLNATPRDLVNVFAWYGELERVNIVSAPRNNESRPGPNEPRKSVYGFVTFFTATAASRALKCRRRLKLNNRKIYVNPADSWHQPDYVPADKPRSSCDPDGYHHHQQQSGEEHNLSKSDNENDKEGGGDGEISNLEEEEEEEEEEQYVMDETESPIAKLNDDCLHHIFSFVPLSEKHVVGSVCRRWRSLIAMIWRSIRELDFSKPPLVKDILTGTKLRRYLKLCKNVTRLNLCQDSHYLNANSIAIVATHCKNLEDIRFSNIDLKNRCLVLLARNIPNLKSFYMDGCSNCRDAEMVALLAKCNQIQSLGLRYSMTLTGRWLKSLGGPLESLTLQMCDFTPEYLMKGINNVKDTLKKLAFMSCISLRCSDLDSLTEIVPNLSSLTLSGAFPEFKAHTLSNISRLTNLVELDLERNIVLCDEFIQDLLKHCHKIRMINFSGTDASLVTTNGLSLLGKFPDLRTLHLSYLSKVSDGVLKSISAKANLLEQLSLVGCSTITDEGCISIISQCQNLRELDLSGCPMVTKQTVISASEMPHFESRKTKLVITIGNSGIDVETEWKSPYVVVNRSTSYLPFMHSAYNDQFLLLEDDYPDYLDDLYELDELAIFDPFDDLDEYDFEDADLDDDDLDDDDEVGSDFFEMF